MPFPNEWCIGCAFNGCYPWNVNPALLCARLGGIYPQLSEKNAKDKEISCLSYKLATEEFWQDHLKDLKNEARTNESCREKSMQGKIYSNQLLPAEELKHKRETIDLPILKLRRLYELLEYHYGVSKMETDVDAESEKVLAELKQTLIGKDKSFMLDNSLFAIASGEGLGESILACTRNKKWIPLDDLKKVFFPKGYGGFITKGVGWNMYVAGGVGYVVYYGKSVESAIQRLNELIEENERLMRELKGPHELEKQQNETYKRLIGRFKTLSTKKN